MNRGPALLLCAMATCALAGARPARADIYSYTDASGITTYTNVPEDGRYRLVLKTPSRGEPAHLPMGLKGGSWRARARAYAALIDQTAHRVALQPALLRAVVAAESGFDPRAVSPAGAQGLMQLLPTTARRYGVSDPFDPAANLDGGARYLSDLVRRYHNNLQLALAAYNAGEDAVERSGFQIPPYAETQAYVPTVMRLYRRFLTQPS